MFTVVRPNKIIDDIQKFVNNLKNNEIISRKVYIDDEEKTIKNVFNPTDKSEDISKNDWQITEINLYKISHLLNIVLSCEFSDNIHFFVSLVKNLINACRKTNTIIEAIDCLKKLNENNILKYIRENILKMISTLVKLDECSKSVLSSKKGILNILLPRSLFLKEIVTRIHIMSISITYNTIKNYLNSKYITHFYIQKRLESFNRNNQKLS